MTTTNKTEEKKVSFLPEGYESLKSQKKYWKLSQFEQGETRLRIVTRPIAGWVDWENNKPHRFLPSQKPKTSFDAEKPMRAFWSCYVWDYKRQDLFILDITQTSIIKALETYGSDSDWGDFTKYDFKLTKEGSGKETRYTLTPIPHKPLTKEIEAAVKASPVRLEALFEGKDPWTDLEPGLEVNRTTGEIKNVALLNSEQLRDIKEVMKLVGQDVCKKWLTWLKVDAVEKIPAEQFDRAMKALSGHLVKEGVA